MAITKEKKQVIIKDLGEKIDNQKSMVFIDFKGTSVTDLTQLRRNLREGDNELKVAKKTLIGTALKSKNIEIDTRGLEGEIGLIFGYKDEVSPSKTVYDFSQDHKTVRIMGGYLNGVFYNAEDATTIAKLPSREELLAKVVGCMNAPVSNFVGVLSGTLRKFVYVLDQVKDKK